MTVIGDMYEPRLSPIDVCGCGSGLDADSWIPLGRGRKPCCRECRREWDEMQDGDAFNRQWDSLALYWTGF